MPIKICVIKDTINRTVRIAAYYLYINYLDMHILNINPNETKAELDSRILIALNIHVPYIWERYTL